MFIRTLLATALLTISAHAASADFERTLPVSGQPDLFVVTGAGSIHVTPGSDSEIHIKAHLSAGWHVSGDAEERMGRIAANPPIRQEGNTVRVGSEDRALFNNITIDYEITAPRAVALDLRSGSGDLEVHNLSRFLRADTGSGSVRANGVGGAAELHTGSGDIELQQSGSGEVRATTSSGSIRIRGLSGGLTAHTGSGDIEAAGALSAPVRLDSGSGSIRLHFGADARYNIEASTGSGSIRVPGTSSDGQHVDTRVNGGGPLLQVRTGSGDIEVN